MNKVDIILESFDLDPLEAGSISAPFYTQQMFEDGQQFLEDTINDARTGVTKQSFVSKIWETIKKILAWCAKQWNRFMNWLRKVFRRKKGQQTADQVASEIIGSKQSEVPASGIKNDTGGTASATDAGTSGSKSGGISSIKVDIPSNPASEAPPEPSIDVLIKPILISYDAAADSFGISITDATLKGYGKVKGQNDNAPKDYVTLLVLIDRPDIFEKLKNACQILHQQYVGSGKIGNEFVNAVAEFDQAIVGYRANTNWVVPFRKLSDFQKSLNDIMELIGNVNISNEVEFENSNVMQTLNNIANYCARLQMSMNSFTRVAAEVHKIDAAYMGSIKTQETLDKFVKAMIDSGIPPKYIGYNTYLACDVSLKGTKGDENNPIWGQSRLVLFPEGSKDDIIKVALSGWGLQSNRSEYETSQVFVKNGGSDLISVTKSIGASGATILSERIQANGKSISGMAISSFTQKLNNFIVRKKIPYSIGDLHGGNVGTKNGQVVALDYAWSNRRNPKDLFG